MGYTPKTIKGISWMGFLRGAVRGLAFVRTAILARFLNPTQFGLFGITSLVLGFLEMLTETGINVFLVQEDDQAVNKYLNTAWFISILRGTIISIAIFLLAPAIASFFTTPQAVSLLKLISIVPFIRGFINPAIIRFQKHLEFNKEFWLRITIHLTDAAVAISLTLFTHQVASLVWGLIASATLEVILSHLLLKSKPLFKLNFPKLKRIISQGKWITVSGILNYLATQGADAAVGKLVGAAPLGVFQLSSRLSIAPITEVTDTFGKVTFPIYVKITQNPQRIKRAFLKNIAVVTAITVPIVLLLIFFPRPIVMLALGNRWLEAVPLIPELAIYSFIRILITLTAPTPGSIPPPSIDSRRRKWYGS